jgi:hypothetical protein
MSAAGCQPRAPCLHTMRRRSLAAVCDCSLSSLLLQQLLLATRLAMLFYSASPTALQPPSLLSASLRWAEWTVVRCRSTPITLGTLFVAHPLCRHNTCSWLAEPPCGSTATTPRTHRPHRRTRLSPLGCALVPPLCRIRSTQVALSSPPQVRTGECTARAMLCNRNPAV